MEEKIQIELRRGSCQLFGMLHLPKNPLGFVVFCHGYLGNRVGRGRLHFKLAEALSRIGIGSLRLDFTACGDSAGSIQEITFETLTADAQTAIAWIQQNYPGYPIGMIGISLGGAVAMLAAARSLPIQAIALLAPFASAAPWRSLVGSKNLTHVSDNTVLQYNNKPWRVGFFKELLQMDFKSAAMQLVDVPLLHVWSQQDQLIDASHRDLYQQWRQDAKAATRFVGFEKSDHYFLDPKEQEELIVITSEWMKELFPVPQYV